MRICPICKSETEDEVCRRDGMPTIPRSSLGRRDDSLVGCNLDGRFEILKCVGSGGMGQVYEARQVSFGRRVALKVVHRHLASDLEQIERFFVEAKASSQLEHPNTVRVFDFGVTSQGVPYLAMEFLEGETLNQRL